MFSVLLRWKVKNSPELHSNSKFLNKFPIRGKQMFQNILNFLSHFYETFKSPFSISVSRKRSRFNFLIVLDRFEIIPIFFSTSSSSFQLFLLEGIRLLKYTSTIALQLHEIITIQNFESKKWSLTKENNIFKFLWHFNSIQFNYLVSQKILLNDVFLFSLEGIPKTDILPPLKRPCKRKWDCTKTKIKLNSLDSRIYLVLLFIPIFSQPFWRRIEILNLKSFYIFFDNDFKKFWQTNRGCTKGELQFWIS